MNKKSLLNFEIVKQDEAGGEIMISTPAVDRDRDRVLPEGARTSSYMKNPVVQWGHDYSSPWATVGKTSSLEIGTDGIKAEFSFREPANDSDPVTIVRNLWTGGYINTASVGFNPIQWEENEHGGFDFTEWELLEWSLVPIPANQEALRLAVKALDDRPEYTTWGIPDFDTGPPLVTITEKQPREDPPVDDYTEHIEALDKLIAVLKGK